MSSVGLSNNVCSESRTPSGSPRIDVTMPNRPSRTWARSSVDSAPGAVAWLPATTTDQRLTPIAQRSRLRCIQTTLTLGRCHCRRHDASVASSPPREVAGEVIDELPRIVLDAVDEARFPPPQHRQPEHVHPRTVDDSAVMPQVAFLIDDRHVQPAVVRPESRCPYDRADLTVAQIDLQPR